MAEDETFEDHGGDDPFAGESSDDVGSPPPPFTQLDFVKTSSASGKGEDSSSATMTAVDLDDENESASLLADSAAPASGSWFNFLRPSAMGAVRWCAVVARAATVEPSLRALKILLRE